MCGNSTSGIIFKGLISRLLYVGHAALAIWRVYHETQDPTYWFLAASILLLIIEGIVSLASRQGKDWGWFSPSVFLYLCGLVPSVWILELNVATGALNVTRECARNIQSTKLVTNASVSALTKLYEAFQTRENWLLAVEQGTLFVLIIGRWLTPLGRLTRNQHSQLLLIYIGTAADIIELFETFKEPPVREDRTLVMIIMAAWTWSLMQYTVVFMSIRKRNKGGKRGSRPQLNIDPEAAIQRSPSATSNIDDDIPKCCDPEIVTPILGIIMQDCPFLALRLYLFYLGIMSPMLLFFVGKNVLIVILQLYRLMAVCCDPEESNLSKSKSWVEDNKNVARDYQLEFDTIP